MINEVSVIGAGTMGNGIAHVFAQNNFNVSLVDISDERLKVAIRTIENNLERQIKNEIINANDKADILNRIKTFSQVNEGTAKSDLIIEAVTEKWEAKAELFSQLDSICKEGAILATNTSSISITRIASVTKRQSNVIGMHFMNPVPVMKLVEIINGFETSKITSEVIHKVVLQLKKIPVTVNDYPGFISNRLLMPFINEAIFSLYEGVAGVEEIDTIMKLGMSHPMGPLELADFIGLDVCLSIMQVLYEGFLQPKYAPCPLLVKMVDAGIKGVKGGEGFYKYEKGTKNKTVSAQFILNRSF